MKHSLLAVATTLALALGACGESGLSTSNNPSQAAHVSEVQANLTLPSGIQIDSVNYTVSGTAPFANRNGVVNVKNSTKLQFRVGDLPIATGYKMALAATAVGGAPCAGEANFAIADNLVTKLTMTLVCGTGVVADVDGNGDVSVSVDVTTGAGVHCPVVTGISALPLEVLVGSSLELSGFASSSVDASTTFSWAGSGGSFTAAAAKDTSFLCTAAGDHALTFAATKTGCPATSMDVTVTCTGSAVVVPDAGTVDAGPAVDAAVDAGPAVDAAVDAGPVVDAAVDAGPGVDAAVDAGPVVDAAVDAGPAVDAAVDAGPTAWYSRLTKGAACGTCVETSCSNYGDMDLAGPCFANKAIPGSPVDPTFAQACTDVFVCSMNSTDKCAFDTSIGVIGCYCGVGVDPSTCSAAFANVKGNCITEWQKVTGCPAGDQNCVLDNMSVLPPPGVAIPFPAGFANYTFECMNANCASACTL